MTEDQLLTTIEAAQLLKCSPDHVGLLLRRGVLKGVKKGRDWLVFQDEVEQYIVNRPRPGKKPSQSS